MERQTPLMCESDSLNLQLKVMCHGPGCLLLIGALNGEPVGCFHCHLVVINYYLYGHCHGDIGFERGV